MGISVVSDDTSESVLSSSSVETPKKAVNTFNSISVTKRSPDSIL